MPKQYYYNRDTHKWEEVDPQISQSYTEIQNAKTDNNGLNYTDLQTRLNTEQQSWQAALPIAIKEEDRFTINVEHVYNPTTPLEYWVTTITPKDNQALTTLLQKDFANSDKSIDMWAKEDVIEHADRVRAVLAINANAWHSSTNQMAKGIQIKDGIVYANTNDSPTTQYTLTVDQNGILNAYPATITGDDLVNKYGVVNSWTHSVPIVTDGQEVQESIKALYNDYYTLNPRQIIGQKTGTNEIVILTVDGRTSRSQGATLSQCASIMMLHNCRFAYNLDGGGSTQTVLYGNFLNNATPIATPDILYIDTTPQYNQYLPIQKQVADAAGSSPTLKDKLNKMSSDVQDKLNKVSSDAQTYVDNIMNIDGALWTGVYYLNANQTVRPTKKLSECNTGWVLVWSDYNAGVGVNDYDFVFSYIPKQYATLQSGNSVLFTVPNYIAVGTQEYINKIGIVYDDRIVGNDMNSSAADATHSRTDAVLRYVFEF
jgi:hypothetical protein